MVANLKINLSFVSLFFLISSTTEAAPPSPYIGFLPGTIVTTDSATGLPMIRGTRPFTVHLRAVKGNEDFAYYWDGTKNVYYSDCEDRYPVSAVTSSTSTLATNFKNCASNMINTIEPNQVETANAAIVGEGTPLTTKFEWNFGDASGPYNQLEGFNAAHVYNNTGRYVVTLKLTNKNILNPPVQKQIVVQVDDNNARKVVYVKATGSSTGDGTSTSTAVNYARASQLISDNIIMKFRKGDVFTIPYNTASGSFRPIYISTQNVLLTDYSDSTSGSNPPTFVWPARSANSGSNMLAFGSSARNVMIENLRFDTRQTGLSSYPDGISLGGVNVTIRNCIFVSLSTAMNGNASPRPQGILIQDNSAPDAVNLRGYFVWLQGKDYVLIKNTAANSAGQHVVRMSIYHRLLFAMNDFANPDDGGVTKGVFTTHKGRYVYFYANTCTDGKVSIGPLGGGDGDDIPGYDYDRTRWVVFEANHLVNNGLKLEYGAEHVMIRNNILFQNGSSRIEIIYPDGSVYKRPIKDVYIINNTGIDSSTGGAFLKVIGSYARDSREISILNNLIVGPNYAANYGGASLFIYDSNNSLRSIRESRHNVFTKVATTSLYDGNNYVWSFWSNGSGSLNSSEWISKKRAEGLLGSSETETDQYEKLDILQVSSSSSPSKTNQYKLPDFSVAARAAKRFAGVFTDYRGVIRPHCETSTWSAGAIELNSDGACLSSLSPSITSFSLINASTGQFIRTLTSGSSIDRTTLPNFGIQAEASNTKSVVFAGSGFTDTTDSAAPFAIDSTKWLTDTGNFTIDATPYSLVSGGGTRGSTKSITINITRSTPIDTTAPSVSVLAPAYLPGAEFLGGAFTVSASATDNVAVTKVELFLDGQLVGTKTSGPDYSFDLTTYPMDAGTHTLQSRAFDAAGNSAVSSSTSIRTTLLGDTNLDGSVTGDDYTLLDSNLGTISGATWIMGDMNGDGAITGDDYTLLDANLGQSVP